MNKKIITVILTAALCITALLTSCADNTTTTTTPDNAANNAPNRTGLTESKITSEPEKAHFIIRDTPASKPARTTSTKDGEVISVLEIEDISITHHERVDKNATEKMRSVINTAAEKRLISLYDSTNANIFTEMATENFDKSSLPYKMAVDYSCTRNDGRAISITETINSYAADVLQHSITTTYNFVPLTGERISQLFYVTGDSDAYNAADNTMYEKLTAKYGADVISYNNVTASFVDVAADCWYFAEDGKSIIVTFSAGRVAPEEAGVIEIEYSKEELPEFAQKFFN